MRRSSWGRPSSALAALILAGAAAQAQLREARPLTGATAVGVDAFSSIAEFLAVGDHRVFVHDATERRFVVIDLSAGSTQLIAPEGAGPLEYRSVGALLRMPGDSVLVWDGRNRRTMLLAPDGRPVRTIQFPDAGNLMATRPNVREGDARGLLYGTDYETGVELRELDPTGTAYLVRWEMHSGRQDTLSGLAVVRPPQTAFREGTLHLRTRGFVAEDVWGVGPDGRVMVVRAASYQVEVVPATGPAAVMGIVAHSPIPVTAADREAYLEDTRRRRGGIAAIARSGEPVRMEFGPPDTWQEHHPPVMNERLWFDPRGRVWVRVRTADESRGARYDLLNDRGRLLDAVRLPPRTRLLGFGATVLFATLEDDDGLLTLQRLPLP